MGNSLRYVLMRSPDVAFCGYSVPHPSDYKMRLRIQTTGKPAIDVLGEQLDTLIAVCDHIDLTFAEATVEKK